MNAKEEIKEGSVVYLKSGSVAMTVEKINGKNAHCVWQEKGKPKEKDYLISSLTTKSPDDDMPLGISMG